MSKIYTRRGDRGMTTLADGKTVAKTSELIEFYGEIDELTAFLGLVLTAFCHVENELSAKIYRIQRELLDLTAQVTAKDKLIFDPRNIAVLEQEIDSINNQLPPLNSFILPGGDEVSARLHVARALCRRVERAAFKLNLPKHQEHLAAYLNRLSDWLYLIARYAALLLNTEEICL